MRTGGPLIFVAANKKELVATSKNGGQEWHLCGQPQQVNVHDLLDPVLGRANPYGVYDLGVNTGCLAVGTDHDTAALAVGPVQHRC